ncbi:MAG TPA: hypothetical protein VIM71_00165 [Lacunisphaera sp.]
MSICGSKRFGSVRGTVSLVALCFVAVLGISLAGYIAVCSRAMTLSNRSFQASLSQQLAELGLEEALRAFNKNDWSDWTSGGISVDWDTTTYSASKRAVATLTLSSDKFGQGTTASVKIRVDNYDAAHLGSTWSSAKTYQINDLVGYNGTWYRSVQDSNLNHTPGDLTWWVPTPIPWSWSSNVSYAAYAVVNYQGAWYRCHTTHTSSSSILPTNISYWSDIPAVSLSWSSNTSYAHGTIMYYSGSWYYCISTHTSSGSITPTNTAYWAPFLNSTGAAVSPGSTTYNVGDAYTRGEYVYRSSNDTWYRCVASQPYIYAGGDYSDTSKWVSSRPYMSWAFRSAATYSFNEVVYYNDTWYRFINANPTAGITPGSNAAYWENALSGTNTTSSPGPHGWSSSSINYNLWDTVYYSGQWYRCIKAHTSGTITPTNTAYWSNTPLFSTAWDSGKQYSQYDTVRYNGVWYLSLQNSNVAQNPATATTYWIGANTSNATYTWNASSNYPAGAYRCYGGVWYKCLISHSNQSPNDTTYWTATWANSAGVTTGAPVIYAEASVSIANSPTLKTQLRSPIAPSPLFPNAAGATTDLTISTGGGTVDSYDSGVATYNSGTAGSSAVLAAGSTLAINGATTVKGYLAWPSPPSGISSGTTLNGLTYSTDKSRVSRSPFVPQFDTLPSNGLTAAFSSANFPKGLEVTDPPGTNNPVNIGTPGATTPARYYYNGALYVSSGDSIGTLNINGPVILYINGHLRTQTGGLINISSTGSAEIHVSGGIRTDSSSSGYYNRTSDPKKLILISDITSPTTQQLASTTYPFYGVIYIPKTTYSLGLDIKTGITIYGALSGKEITFSSEANLHYDTSLRYATFGGVDQPYAATEWRELPVTEQATLP